MKLSREVGGVGCRKIETWRLENGAGGKWHCGAELEQSYSPGQGEEEKTQHLLSFPKMYSFPLPATSSHTYARVLLSPTQSPRASVRI